MDWALSPSETAIVSARYAGGGTGVLWYIALPMSVLLLIAFVALVREIRRGHFTPERLLKNQFARQILGPAKLSHWGWLKLGGFRVLPPALLMASLGFLMGWLSIGIEYVWQIDVVSPRLLGDLGFVLVLLAHLGLPIGQYFVNCPRFWMPREFREQPGMIAGWRRGVSAQDVARGRYWPGEPFKWRQPDEDVEADEDAPG